MIARANAVTKLASVLAPLANSGTLHVRGHSAGERSDCVLHRGDRSWRAESLRSRFRWFAHRARSTALAAAMTELARAVTPLVRAATAFANAVTPGRSAREAGPSALSRQEQAAETVGAVGKPGDESPGRARGAFQTTLWRHRQQSLFRDDALCGGLDPLPLIANELNEPPTRER